MQSIILGNFDGVHLGHQALLKAAKNCSQTSREGSSKHLSVVAITFGEPPRAVLDPTFVVQRLQTVEDRVACLRRFGATQVEVLAPTKELLGLRAEQFVVDLHTRFPFDRIVEGSDFRFGRGREGTVDLLRSLGARLGFEVVEVPSVRVALHDGSIVEARSGTIRELIRSGSVCDANRLLGRGFSLCTRVVRGDQRGRTIGWPTANLDSNELSAQRLLLPGDGVYAGFARVKESIGGFEASVPALAAISVGSKPTFGGSGTTIEATLLHANGQPLRLPSDAYGWSLELEFRDRLRSQVRFESLEALLAQMELDRARIVEIATSLAE